MYDDFTAVDRWSGEPLHCTYQAVIVAIATRHADAIDIKFLCGGRPVWIALPHLAWVKYKEQTGKAITDPLAIQIAGRYVKSAIESGYDNGRGNEEAVGCFRRRGGRACVRVGVGSRGRERTRSLSSGRVD